MDEKDKMKDLLIKMQILTNELIEERKKSKNYLSKIKELENILQAKDNEIVALTKVKFDLEANLSIERSKKPQIKKKKKKMTEEMQLEKYEEIINEQGYKLRNLTNKLVNDKEAFEQQKSDFQIMMKTQTKQMEELQKNLENVKKENEDLLKRQKDINETLKEFEVEKLEYKRKFERYEIDKIEVQTKNVNLQETIDKLRKEIMEKEEKMKELNKKGEDMAKKLDDMKNAIINRKLTKKSFKVMLVKSKKTIEIIFQKVPDIEKENLEKYEMIIIGKNKNNTEDHIDLLDVSSFVINEKEKCRVDISYTVRNIN